ncbi:MAG: class I SAM-dependent methyltransferase [Terrimicrobiaceae bacterium]|nr:class I SAM-dependent methyltransferase [Terrimicrobiaceae bacterium]
MSPLCRVCDSQRLEMVLDLGMQPWCNHFLTAEEVGREPIYPLRLFYCLDCSTSQLDHTVPKETMFGDHTYLSGTTRSLGEHFREVAESLDRDFAKNKSPKCVLDIGSNDGTQLRHFQNLGYEVLGVESSKTTAAIANRSGIPTLNAFFNLDLAGSLGREFDIINASGVFFHLEELHSVTEGIRHLLKKDGIFVVQFLYMKRIMENGAFDQIYHEHLLYYNMATLSRLLERHGLEIFDARLAPIHGGSIIAHVGFRGARPPSSRVARLLGEEKAAGSNTIGAYHAFAERTRHMRGENLAYLEKANAEGKGVMGMGAPVKGNTMLNYFGVGPGLIRCLVEKNPLRKGLFAPGSHIPVVMEEEVTTPPDIYFVLAWNFKREILQNNQDLIGRGVEFYFPVDPDRVHP